MAAPDRGGRGVVGAVVAFGDIPAAITAMAERRTIGRTVVLVDEAPTAGDGRPI